MSTTFDPKEVDPTDNWLNPKDTELPESPLSIHIDSYFKGFHAGITIRMMDNSTIPALRIKNAINALIEGGFEPSWNKDTSTQHLAGNNPSKGITHPQNAQICGIHNTPMTLKPAGISKTGRPYPAFWSCGVRNIDNSYCNYKPTINS